MRLISDKTYAYSSNYEIGLFDFVKWIIFTFIYLSVMCAAQLLILNIYNNNEVDIVSRGMLPSVN